MDAKTMSNRTKGAWVIAHSLKLQQVDAHGQFANIEAAGKFGRLLSVMSADEDKQQIFSKEKMTIIAKANNINPTLDLETLLRQMEQRHIISRAANGSIALLGITHGSVLERTAETFDSLSPETEEVAVIDIAERVSESPIRTDQMLEHVSDTFKLKKERAKDTVSTAEAAGFVDAEDL